jgi:hypothetical protein
MSSSCCKFLQQVIRGTYSEVEVTTRGITSGPKKCASLSRRHIVGQRGSPANLTAQLRCGAGITRRGQPAAATTTTDADNSARHAAIRASADWRGGRSGWSSHHCRGRRDLDRALILITGASMTAMAYTFAVSRRETRHISAPETLLSRLQTRNSRSGGHARYVRQGTLSEIVASGQLIGLDVAP